MNAAVWIAAIIVLAYVAFLILIVMSAVAVRVTRGVRGWLRSRRAGHRTFDEINAGVIQAVLCDPCGGKPGNCRCTRKCTHPLCGAADTGVALYSDRDARWLRGIGIVQDPSDIPGEKPS